MDFPDDGEYRQLQRFRCATTHTHTHTHTAILSLLLFTVGCNNGIIDKPPSACEEQCDLGLSPFPMNLVVLTADGAAPLGPTTSIDSCASADTSWPCLHPNSLNVRFVEHEPPGSEDLICGDRVDPINPNTCVSFVYGKHANYSTVSALTDTACVDALDRADPATTWWTSDGQYDYGAPTPVKQYYDDFTAAVTSCPDERFFDPAMINVYLFLNPVETNISFNNEYGDCLHNNFIDLVRLPTNPADPFNFREQASEHEMGHGFELGHTCVNNQSDAPVDAIVSDVPNSETDPSGIMQTTADKCCCEAAETHVASSDDRAHDWDYGSGDYFPTICSDCSADPGNPASSSCDDSPGPYDDPACDASGYFSHGNRSLGFSNTYDAKWEVSDSADDHPGQVTRILESAYDMCVCRCDMESAEENSRVAVANELACHGGTGRFALLPIDWTDQNDNELGFSNLAPVLVSGGHLGRLSWITSATLVSPGSASRLVIPSVTQGWSFSGSDPDLLTATGLTVVDNAHPTFTFAPGMVGGAFFWGADGIAPLSEGFEPPQVDLQWVCAPEIRSGDVLWVHRPPGPYALHAQLIGAVGLRTS